MVRVLVTRKNLANRGIKQGFQEISLLESVSVAVTVVDGVFVLVWVSLTVLVSRTVFVNVDVVAFGAPHTPQASRPARKIESLMMLELLRSQCTSLYGDPAGRAQANERGKRWHNIITRFGKASGLKPCRLYSGGGRGRGLGLSA